MIRSMLMLRQSLFSLDNANRSLNFRAQRRDNGLESTCGGSGGLSNEAPSPRKVPRNGDFYLLLLLLLLLLQLLLAAGNPTSAAVS